MNRPWVPTVIVTCILGGCGGDQGTAVNASDTATGGAADGTGGAGQASGGGAGVQPKDAGSDDGSPPTAGSGGGSSDAAAPAQGAFGLPEFLYRAQTVGSPTLTADELELFLVLEDEDDALRIAVMKRASVSEPFAMPVDVPELAACSADAFPSIDVTADGLRMYLDCAGLESSGQLYRAERPDRDSPFVVDADPIGTVGLSIDVGADELTAYSSPDDSHDFTQMFTRSSVNEDFSLAARIPGLAGELSAPELAADGLTMFGHIWEEGSTRLAAAYRSSTTEPFGPPNTDGLPVRPDGEADGSPVISGDGHGLYFLRSDREARDITLQVARR
jgi:hypothetical protein